MAQRLNVFLSGGAGSVTLSPEPTNGFYNTGDNVTVTLTLDTGFTFVNWAINGVVQGTSTTIVVTIGRSDILLVGNATGAAVASFNYGLRYWDEYVDSQGRKSRITIEQKDYIGSDERVIIKNPVYQIGEFDSDPTKLFVTSRLDFTFQIVKNQPDLSVLLTLDPRRFRVKWYRDYTNDTTYGNIWIGYLKTDFLSRPEYLTTYDIQVTATDGLSDLEGYLIQVPSLNFSTAANTVTQLLNLTFKDGLGVKTCVRVFEDEMTSLDSDDPFSQFSINQDALYEDDVRYQENGSTLIFNPGKNVLRGIETLTKQFVTRVFQWNGYWWIVRVFEYEKDTLKITQLDEFGDFDTSFPLANDQEFTCIGNPVKNGQVSYTRFNVSLKLGSVNRPESRTIISENFGQLSWFNPNPRAAGNTLKRWQYVNAVVFNGNRDSEYSGVQRYSNPSGGEAGEYVILWSTANGLSDPLLSGIKYDSFQYGGAVKLADTISINVKFQTLRRGSSDSRIPPAGSHVVAMTVKVGSSFLQYDGNTTFTWSTSPIYEFMQFPVNNTGVFNVIDIQDIVIPETGLVEITLHQMITISGSRHRYLVTWEDLNIDLSRNDALTYKEIRGRGITDEVFEREFDNFETFIGDALTPLSSSAIILPSGDVSEEWAREGESESVPLLDIVLQDLINIYGKNNYTHRAQIMESDAGAGIDFSRGITYKGKKHIFTAAKLDDRSGIWDFEFYQLQPE